MVIYSCNIEESLYVPPKRRFTQDLHGATSQKTAFFIVTAVKTSNLTDVISFKRLTKLFERIIILRDGFKFLH
jgi:hypothetical protein